MSRQVISREALLLARLHVEELVHRARWEDAAEIGAAVLSNSENLAAASQDRLRVACSLSALGALSNISAAGTLAPLLQKPGIEREALAEGVAALKVASLEDCQVFLDALPCALGTDAPRLSQTLLLLEAVADLADSHVATALFAYPPMETALRCALSDASEDLRGHAICVVGSLVRAAPAALCARLCPVLSTAVLVEVPALQALALSIVGDAVFALAHVPASSHEPRDRDELVASVTEQLSSCLALLSAQLYSPTAQLQQISALALSKLVLGAANALLFMGGQHSARPESRRRRGGADWDSDEDEAEGVGREEALAFANEAGAAESSRGQEACGSMEGGVLLASVDPERLIADLAFRYTADENVASKPKHEQTAHAALMMSMLACFEGLVAERCAAVLSNTIVWVLLGAAEVGALDFARPHAAPPPLHELDERTLRCLRFLTSLVTDTESTAAARHEVTRSLCEAARINLQLEHAIDLDVPRIASWLGVAAGP